MVKDAVSVITLSRNRPELLQRAIDSVSGQDYSGPYKHLVLVDNCSRSAAYLSSKTNLPKNLVWKMALEDNSEFGPWRISKLRNHAIACVSADWVSFLDDDNEFEPNHLSSLVKAAKQSGRKAAHSFRKLLNRDGTPYLEHKNPWIKDPVLAHDVYQRFCDAGICERGSNIVKDCIDTSAPLGSKIISVDTSEWLISRDWLIAHPYDTEFSGQDLAAGIADDGKLLIAMIEDKLSVASTGLSTLRYYLGGWSNFDVDSVRSG